MKTDKLLLSIASNTNKPRQNKGAVDRAQRILQYCKLLDVNSRNILWDI
jgi:hypothetical protein